MTLQIYTGARGSKFVCDTNGGFGDAVAMISREADAPIISCAREKAAEPYLLKIGKMSQVQLYNCAQAKALTKSCPSSCHGNCNPANAPGQSTHERRNDGVAYKGWAVGNRIPVWARGIDVQRDRVAAFCAAGRKHGWLVTATYPGSPSESQHVNFRKKPAVSLWQVRPWHPGDGGPRGRLVRGALQTVLDPQTRKPYLVDPRSAAQVEKAVKAFQKDHHQTQDGVVGLNTWTALSGAKRGQPRITSKEGVEKIKGFEGFRSTAYKPVASEKYWTIGYGHNGPDVAENSHIGLVTAENLLRRDLKGFEAAVRQVAPWVNQEQFDALVSAAYNLGPGVLDKGRSLGDAVRSSKIGRNKRVANALKLYVYGDPKQPPLPGLVARRAAEAKAFA
jgi:GH24 family phage-related lysozyme (muramidase)